MRRPTRAGLTRTRLTRACLTIARLTIGALALAGCRGGAPAGAAPLLVFAAADLREALPAVAAAYRRAGGDSVTLVFGATGELAAQVAGGAPADLLLAADEGALARLAAAHAVVDSTRRAYAVGRLALVGVTVRATDAAADAAGAASRAALDALGGAAVRTVAVADPARAPYGRAARQALERAGLWPRVGPKVVYAPNVAQAFRFVQAGNADAGLVALSAVAARAGGPPYAVVDPALYDPIRQAGAVVAGSRRPREAARFLAFAAGAPGFAVLRRYGFSAPNDPAPNGLTPNGQVSDTPARRAAR